MSIFTKKKILVTHSGRFHADDIFATATLSLLHDGKIKIIRTRDEGIIAKADYVYDVGGVYDEVTNRFDHHQVGGAGVRSNGIPYAAFGLVWKKYGDAVCGGSHAVAHQINKKLVQPIDANDNGMDLFTLKSETAPYLLQDVFSLWRPSYTEELEYDAPFLKMVDLARAILIREIKKTKDAVDAEAIILDAYHNAIDKRIIIIDGLYPWGDLLGKFAEPLYVVHPKSDGAWGVSCVRADKHTYENRKSLPQAWAGLVNDELAKVTGVADATFCHNGRFLAVARSKEGAISLAEKALLA
jgi:uncharacterized UPF0160 family protein